MFSRFIAKKSASDGEIGKTSLQTELREFVLKTNCHRLFDPSVTCDSETAERIISQIAEYSSTLDPGSDSSTLIIALCCLMTEKICESAKCVSCIVNEYYMRMLQSGVHAFVQTITLNMCFLILDKLMVTEILDWISQMDQNSLQHNYPLIETGLSVFLNNHFDEFAAKMHWKAIMKLLGCGIIIRKYNDLVEKTEFFHIDINISDQKSESPQKNKAGGKHKNRCDSRNSVSPKVAEGIKNEVKWVVNTAGLI
jgi:hypothetical protein